MYNNVLKDWGSYAIGSSFRAQTLAEGNIFDSEDQYGSRAIITQVGVDPEPGFVRAVNNLFLGTASGGSSGADKVFTPPYQYTYDTPTVALETRLLQQAGVEGSDTLNLMALKTEEQVAVNYAAFFARAPDAHGFEFWVGQFNDGRAKQGAATLFANIASSFGVSNEAKALYPFLANPQKANDSQIKAFLDTVYDNMFNRSLDAPGLAYWSNQIKQALAGGKFVGSVLVDIISGTQAGSDLRTLTGKMEVALEYVHQEQAHNTRWSGSSDITATTALLDAVTSDPQTVLVGIKQADQLIATHA